MQTLKTISLRTAAIAGFAAIAACATSTPYVAADTSGNGYGFSEQRIESNRYRVMFRGNSSTTRETVENFLLFRAAELTLLNDFDHFIVVENDTEANRRLRTTATASPAFYGRYGGFGFAGRGFPYYAYGFGWGFPYDATTREIIRYSATAYIVLGKGPKPADNPLAFDAREVMDNLRPLVFDEAGAA